MWKWAFSGEGGEAFLGGEQHTHGWKQANIELEVTGEHEGT